MSDDLHSAPPPPFPHRHSGHCESGVMSSLLSHFGLAISEPMAFGITSTMTFFHLPLIKMGGVPLTAYRMAPGHIMRGVRKRLGVRMISRRFRNADAGMAELDALLGEGRPVGLQTSVYWLPYFPRDMRFHFNAHNMIAYGKDGNDYLISDPVIDHPLRCPAQDLRKARFTKGILAPKGRLYYPLTLSGPVDLGQAVQKALRRTIGMMLNAPFPFVGVRAIRRLANTIERLDAKYPDEHYQRLFLSSIIRMQEEIGTGGGGFRFIYASFLQEVAHRLESDALHRASEQMTAVGDQWREFASLGALFCRGRRGGELPVVADALRAAAAQEEAVYRYLRTVRIPTGKAILRAG